MLEKIYKAQKKIMGSIQKTANSFDRRHKLIFISDGADWVIRDIADQITKEINKHHKETLTAKTGERPEGYQNKIIHCGALPILNKIDQIDKNNQIIQTVFHIDKNHGPLIDKLKNNLDRIKYIHTACQSTKDKLVAAGIAAEKIKLIPLGVDRKIFQPVEQEQKKIIRQKLGLPEDKIIIGSFQKDGNGWGEGWEPKLIKGPDIFCDAVIDLAKKFPLHVLLTGPARGYVKKRLTEAGVSYTHKYLKNYNDLVPYWQALDLYLITSRIEGGPKAILEAWATGVPLVSTKVGMVPDLATNRENAILTEIEDTQAIISGAEQILENKESKEKLIFNGLNEVQKYSWEKIAERYYQEIYSPLWS